MVDPVYKLKKTVTDEDLNANNNTVCKYGSWFCFVILLLIYLRTVTPGMQTGDGTELAAAAYVLGVPHPTGYPLYMILVKIWMTILGPVFQEPILISTLFSAVCIAASCGIIFRMAYDFLSDFWKDINEKFLAVAAGSIALSSGLLRYHWSNSVETEVYALQFLLMIGFCRTVQLAAKGIKPGHLFTATVLLALGIAHHRLTVVMVPGYIFLLWLIIKTKSFPLFRPRNLLVCFGILLAGISIYAYIPLRAAANPPVNWGGVNTFSRFIDHVRGTMYLEQSFMRGGAGKAFGEGYSRFLGKMSGQLVAHFTEQSFPVINPLNPVAHYGRRFYEPNVVTLLIFSVVALFAAYGTWALLKKNKSVLPVFFLLGIGNLAVIYVYNISDIFDYYLFPFWLGWFLSCMGGALLLYQTLLKKRPYLSYGLVLIPVIVFYTNWGFCNRSEDVLAETVSAVILPDDKSVMPENSILLTTADTDTFTTWYRQYVRAERTDVQILMGNFLWQSWYPDVLGKEKIEKYGLKFPDGVAVGPQEFFGQLDDGIIAPNIDKYPIFTTITDKSILDQIAKKYSLTEIDAAIAGSENEKVIALSLYKITRK